MRARLAEAWRSMTMADRVVGAIALLLALSTDLAPRALFLVAPELDNRSRFIDLEREVDRAGPSGGPSPWTDAQGRPLPWGFPYRGYFADGPFPPAIAERPEGHEGWFEAVYASAPGFPRDRWGTPWQLVVAELRSKDLVPADVNPPVDAVVYSAGPDGRFEWGGGDDVQVHPNDGGLRRTWWWPLCWLAGLVLFPYLTVRIGALPRSHSVAVELARASTMSIAPLGLARFFFADMLERAFPDAPAWMLVSGPTAAIGTAALGVWSACVLFRLRRPGSAQSALAPSG
jgi:hypothetical protein